MIEVYRGRKPKFCSPSCEETHKKSMDKHKMPVGNIIDCSVGKNAISEQARMCLFRDCVDCTFGSEKDCIRLAKENPKEYIEKLQEWSNANPIEPVVTILDKLLEVFPNTELNEDGLPYRVCPHNIGYSHSLCLTIHPCKQCWSQPYEVAK